MELGGSGWIVAVNLIIWTGLFLYLLRLGKRLRLMEKESCKRIVCTCLAGSSCWPSPASRSPPSRSP